MQDNAVIIHEKDNVAVTLRDLKAREAVIIKGKKYLALPEDIPASHKLALRDISAGEEIIKYGEVVGVSTGEIAQGMWVHTHNLEGSRWKK